jgi:hypothetical protein
VKRRLQKQHVYEVISRRRQITPSKRPRLAVERRDGNVGDTPRTGRETGDPRRSDPPCPHTATAAIHIRDSKNPDGPNLTVTGEAWGAFLAGAA